MVPDSRTPRRLTAMSTTTRTTASSASWPRSPLIADAAYCAPEEIETATVST